MSSIRLIWGNTAADEQQGKQGGEGDIGQEVRYRKRRRTEKDIIHVDTLTIVCHTEDIQI